jgi:hypothetical protein
MQAGQAFHKTFFKNIILLGSTGGGGSQEVVWGDLLY